MPPIGAIRVKSDSIFGTHSHVPELLVDQGAADQFLKEQLRSELLKRACADALVAPTTDGGSRRRPVD